MKRIWLLVVPVLALMALFAVRSAPTLAGPICASTCGNAAADQGVPVGRLLAPAGYTTTYAAGGYLFQAAQVPGEYCSDKTGGQIWVPDGTQPDTGLTCPAVSASPAPAGTSTGGAAASPAPAASKTATATPTGTAHP